MSDNPFDEFLFDSPPKPALPAHLDLDYHNTEACALLMRLIGVISVDWNYCELFFAHLIWHYVGGSDVGKFITPGLGNQSRADLLLALAKKYERSKRYLEYIEFAAYAFGRMREWRNKLIHSHSIMPLTATGKLLRFLRMPTNGSDVIEMRLTVAEVHQIYDCIACLGLYVGRLHSFKFAQTSGMREKLPPQFPLPNIPIRPRPGVRKGAKRRKQSFAALKQAPTKPSRSPKLSSAQKRKAREAAEGGSPS